MRSGAELIYRAEWRIGFTAADIISAVDPTRTSATYDRQRPRGDAKPDPLWDAMADVARHL